MGNNQAYTFMEATVVGAYDLGVLNLKLLKVLLEPYRGCDIDHGGCLDLKAKDGLEADDIIIKLTEPKTFQKLDVVRQIIRKYPKNYNKLTEKQQATQEKFYEDRAEAIIRITRKKFGWC